MKLTNKQIKEIRSLHKKGIKIKEIATKFNVGITTIYYHISEESRRKRIQQVIESFKKKPLIERKKIYKRRLPYLREYQKNKYRTDEDFRLKKLEKSKDYYKKKKVKRND